MKILITGICGFVGSTLTRALLASSENLQITGVDNFIRPGSELNRRELAQLGVTIRHAGNGPTDFTDVAPAATPSSTFSLQVRNPGDLYLYSNNNIQAVKIKGADLKNWLETSAKQFAQIDPASPIEQDLVPSYSTIYNYDVFYAENNALKYQIDVTKPVGSRIVNLTYNNTPVPADADFIVATNDYRAGGGGNFPGINGTRTILKSPDSNQSVVANFLTRQSRLSRASNGSGNSWGFVKVSTAGPVVLRSAPDKLAVAQAAGLALVTSQGGIDASGYAKYRIDLSK